MDETKVDDHNKSIKDHTHYGCISYKFTILEYRKTSGQPNI
jgi:hypothetical protein